MISNNESAQIINVHYLNSVLTVAIVFKTIIEVFTMKYNISHSLSCGYRQITDINGKSLIPVEQFL